MQNTHVGRFRAACSARSDVPGPRLLLLALPLAAALMGCGGEDGEEFGRGESLAKTESESESPADPAEILSGDTTVVHVEIPSAGGHRVPVSIHRPVEASAASPVPVLLHSHGWSGSRSSGADAFRAHARAGMGVVSIDMRGHGAARRTSEARVHHVDYEIRDVSAVIDHIAELDWVAKDGPGDPRLGGTGISYGGAFQLLAAALDGRLDAMAPEIAWSDLARSLAPDGAPKSAWLDLLYGAGNARARLHPDVHAAFAYVESTNAMPDGSVPGTPDILSQLADSSPASYPGGIAIPTLLVQGMSDTLFNFNEAADNYAQIGATGAPVRLSTHLGGHLLPVLQPIEGPSPCGSKLDQVLAWHQKHLMALDVSVGPAVCLALDDGTAVSGSSFPLPEEQVATFTVAGSAVIAQLAPITVELPVTTARKDMVLAGIPAFQATVSSPGPDSIVYFSLKAISPDGSARVLNSQVTPMRVAGPVDRQQRSLPMMGIGSRLRAGERLVLVASSVSDQFLHNAGRIPGAVTLESIKLKLPVIKAN